MNSLEYQKLVQRTKSEMRIHVGKHNEDLLHATMGAATEAGELLDAVKKHLFYGKPLDMINLQEEVGDILWYLAVLCEWSGTTLEEQMEHNINKLRIRYPEKFDANKALNRDVVAELQAYGNDPVQNKA